MTYLIKNVYDVIKQRSLFGFEERKKEVNYMDAKVFGKFIMERRKQLGMTQAELAEKINVTDKAVSFFKQKTAYAISTRDWSSDVCSSDLQLWWILLPVPPQLRPGRQLTRRVPGEER